MFIWIVFGPLPPYQIKTNQHITLFLYWCVEWHLSGRTYWIPANDSKPCEQHPPGVTDTHSHKCMERNTFPLLKTNANWCLHCTGDKVDIFNCNAEKLHFNLHYYSLSLLKYVVQSSSKFNLVSFSTFILRIIGLKTMSCCISTSLCSSPSALVSEVSSELSADAARKVRGQRE